MTSAVELILVAVIAAPFALGLLARFHRDGLRGATWYWRAWWFCGYHLGLYRINWAWKRRHERSPTMEERELGRLREQYATGALTIEKYEAQVELLLRRKDLRARLREPNVTAVDPYYKLVPTQFIQIMRPWDGSE